MGLAARSGAVLVTALLLGGCFPFPHFQQRSPVLDGQLLRGGQPLAQVPVYFIAAASEHQRDTLWQVEAVPCAGERQTTTDARGHFRVDRTREFEFFIIFGDRLDNWQLCFDLPDGQSARWAAFEFWGGPAQLNLTCDLLDGKLSCDALHAPSP